MNWSSITFDWNQARAFLVTADEGTLTAAAEKLGTTQPTLGRQITALESELGVRLFDRIGRSLILTPTGTALLEHVRNMAEAAAGVSLAASGHAVEVEGTVVLSASESIAAYILPNIIRELRSVAPGISIDVIGSNEVHDLRRRDADIAIRHTTSEHGDLITRRVNTFPIRFYAAKSYIEAFGSPSNTTDLCAHTYISLHTPDRRAREIAFLEEAGFKLPPNIIHYGCDNDVARWQLVKQGLGIAIQWVLIGRADPEVEQLFPDFALADMPVWLVTHPELKTSLRIRTVYDFLAEKLSALN